MVKALLAALAALALPATALAQSVVTMGPEDYRAGRATEFVDQAAVVRVEPLFVEINRPARICETGYQQEPAGDKAAGQVMGGIIGGLLGHQVGGGSGKTAATIGGAIAGSMIGANMAEGAGGMTPVERCRLENRYVREQQGYRVTYRYQGREVTETLSRDPGRQVPVRVMIRAEP